MTPPPPPSRLGPRADGVFDAVLHGRKHLVHPDDSREAAGFWDWLETIERPEGGVASQPWSGRRAGIAVAAALLLAFSGILFWQLPGTSSRAFAETYQSDRAERRAMRLVDGSTITLAPSSALEIRYASDERRVRLVRGQGMFQVAGDPSRPFIVELAQGEVQAVGTAFDIVAAADQASVTVIEGAVRIAVASEGHGDKAVVKQARMGDIVRFGVKRDRGEQISFVAQSGGADIDRATAWTRGILIFRGESLRQAIDTVNLYSRDTVRLVDPRLASLPVYGVVNQGDTSALRELVADPHLLEIAPDEAR